MEKLEEENYSLKMQVAKLQVALHKTSKRQDQGISDEWLARFMQLEKQHDEAREHIRELQDELRKVRLINEDLTAENIRHKQVAARLAQQQREEITPLSQRPQSSSFSPRQVSYAPTTTGWADEVSPVRSRRNSASSDTHARSNLESRSPSSNAAVKSSRNGSAERVRRASEASLRDYAGGRDSHSSDGDVLQRRHSTDDSWEPSTSTVPQQQQQMSLEEMVEVIDHAIAEAGNIPAHLSPRTRSQATSMSPLEAYRPPPIDSALDEVDPSQLSQQDMHYILNEIHNIHDQLQAARSQLDTMTSAPLPSSDTSLLAAFDAQKPKVAKPVSKAGGKKKRSSSTGRPGAYGRESLGWYGRAGAVRNTTGGDPGTLIKQLQPYDPDLAARFERLLAASEDMVQQRPRSVSAGRQRLPRYSPTASSAPPKAGSRKTRRSPTETKILINRLHFGLPTNMPSDLLRSR